ncbi:MAG: MFS transporter, partial [Spirochaetota bacterium]|nr:MFS transporter [Spirochaetota bacterium]
MRLKTVINKEIFGWAMFDFANSSYTTVIITVMFSRYFVNHVVPDTSQGPYMWSVTLSISYLLVAVLSPFIGALADYTGRKKLYLFATTAVCVVFTISLYLVNPGDLYLGIILIVLSNIGFSLGENLISSFLPQITTNDHIGFVSGFGWGLGYVGGFFAILGASGLSKLFDNIPLSYQAISVFIGFYFAISAIPTFIWLKDRNIKKHKSLSMVQHIKAGNKRLIETIHHIREFKELVKLLVAFFFYFGGLATLVSFSAVYASNELGFTTDELVAIFLATNVSSSVGAVLFGLLEDKVGAKKTLGIILILWVFVLVGIYFTTSKSAFWVLSFLAGIGTGSVQSATRAMVGLFSPQSK